MPPALFYLFGLIYYNNRRTPAAFILFVFLTGAFLASLNYSFLQSSLYWTSAFTLLLVAFFPDLLKATWVVVTQLWSSKVGRLLLVLWPVLWISAFIAFVTPHLLNLGEVIRVSAAGPIDYNLSLAGDFGLDAIAAWPAWINFLMWSPMPELHDKLLKFDPWGAGIDHRYLGMASLPLLCVALTRAGRDRYVLVVFLTFAICALFVVYTIQNLALLPLIERSSILQNIRTMSNTMPREGPSIMIMLLARHRNGSVVEGCAGAQGSFKHAHHRPERTDPADRNCVAGSSRPCFQPRRLRSIERWASGAPRARTHGDLPGAQLGPVSSPAVRSCAAIVIHSCGIAYHCVSGSGCLSKRVLETRNGLVQE